MSVVICQRETYITSRMRKIIVSLESQTGTRVSVPSPRQHQQVRLGLSKKSSSVSKKKVRETSIPPQEEPAARQAEATSSEASNSPVPSQCKYNHKSFSTCVWVAILTLHQFGFSNRGAFFSASTGLVAMSAAWTSPWRQQTYPNVMVNEFWWPLNQGKFESVYFYVFLSVPVRVVEAGILRTEWYCCGVLWLAALHGSLHPAKI